MSLMPRVVHLEASRELIYVELAGAGFVADPHSRVLGELHELAQAHLAGRRWHVAVRAGHDRG
ncbi:hypothetical protein GCM10023199_55130 [Actinomycetospora chibensis]